MLRLRERVVLALVVLSKEAVDVGRRVPAGVRDEYGDQFGRDVVELWVGDVHEGLCGVLARGGPVADDVVAHDTRGRPEVVEGEVRVVREERRQLVEPHEHHEGDGVPLRRERQHVRPRRRDHAPVGEHRVGAEDHLVDAGHHREDACVCDDRRRDIALGQHPRSLQPVALGGALGDDHLELALLRSLLEELDRSARVVHRQDDLVGVDVLQALAADLPLDHIELLDELVHILQHPRFVLPLRRP
mmetsp:Transcript_41315/g.97984  ORF Transcript_41315/g.97984 Transcript_41315/m.97984 type:complete len:245 (+) Transcript_41315:294-1028(+)